MSGRRSKRRASTPPPSQPGPPESLLQREKDRKRGSPVRWCGDMQRIDRRYTCRRLEGCRRLSLPLVLPPLRERRGPARSAAGRGKMPSTRGAMREPEQKPPPPRPFSRGRRTGRGDGGGPGRWFGDVQRIDGRYPCRRRGGCRPVLPPSCSPSSEGETWPCTFWHGQTRDAIDERGDTPTRAETSSPASLLQRETDRKRGGGNLVGVRWQN